MDAIKRALLNFDNPNLVIMLAHDVRAKTTQGHLSLDDFQVTAQKCSGAFLNTILHKLFVDHAIYPHSPSTKTSQPNATRGDTSREQKLARHAKEDQDEGTPARREWTSRRRRLSRR